MTHDADIVHAAILRYIVTLGETVAGARLTTGEGLLTITSPLPIANGNQVLVEAGGAAPGALGAAVDRLRAGGHPVRVTLREGIDDALLPVVRALGLRPRPWAPGMVLRPLRGAGDPGPTAPGLEIRSVDGQADLDDFIRAMAPAYGQDPADTRRVVAPCLLERPDVELVVGRAGGEPVATGMGIRTGSVVGVYFIGTVPGARRRGYGEAITARVTADAAAAGCDTAVLQASPLGLGVYERMGYRRVSSYVGWLDASA